MDCLLFRYRGQFFFLKEAKKYPAKVIAKKVVRGYKGRTTYTFEIQMEDKEVHIEKDNLHRDLKMHQVVEVYPAYDEQKT